MTSEAARERIRSSWPLDRHQARRAFTVTPYQQMIQSIWAVLFNHGEPACAYALSDGLWAIERNGGTAEIHSTGLAALERATAWNIALCEDRLEPFYRLHDPVPLDTVIIAWECYTRHVLGPWIRACWDTQIWDREGTIGTVVPLFYPTVTALPFTAYMQAALHIKQLYNSPIQA